MVSASCYEVVVECKAGVVEVVGGHLLHAQVVVCAFVDFEARAKFNSEEVV